MSDDSTLPRLHGVNSCIHRVSVKRGGGHVARVSQLRAAHREVTAGSATLPPRPSTVGATPAHRLWPSQLVASVDVPSPTPAASMSTLYPSIVSPIRPVADVAAVIEAAADTPDAVFRLSTRHRSKWRTEQGRDKERWGERGGGSDSLVAGGWYDLVAVPDGLSSESLAEEWVFRSPSVTYRRGALPPTSQPTDHWVIDRRKYIALRNIPLIRSLPLLKALRKWRTNIRSRRFAAMRVEVARKTQDLPLYHSVHHAAHDLSAVALIHFPAALPGKPTECLVEDFVTVQRDLASGRQLALADIITRIAADIPPDVVGICNAILSEAVVKHTLHCISTLATSLSAEPTSHPSLSFRARVTLTDNLETIGSPLPITPSKPILEEAVQEVVRLTVHTASSAPRMVVIPLADEVGGCGDEVDSSSDTKSQSSQGGEGALRVVADTTEPLAPPHLVTATPVYQHSTAQLATNISEAYRVGTSHTDQLHVFVRWLDWIRRKWIHTKGRWDREPEGVTVEDFTGILEHVHAAERDVRTRLVNTKVGALYFTYANIRNVLVPPLSVIRSCLSVSLVDTASCRAERLVTFLEKRVRDLRVRITDLDSWADWAEVLEDSKRDKESILGRLNEIRSLFRIIHSIQAPCGSDKWSLHNRLLPCTADELERGREGVDDVSLQEQFLTAVDEAQAYKQAELTRQREALDERIQQIEAECKGYWEAAMSGEMVNPASDPTAMLEKLEGKRCRLDELTTNSETCLKYQGLCGFPPASWTMLKGATEAVHQRITVWRALAEFAALREKAHSQPLTMLDSDTLRCSLDDYSRVAYKLAKEVDDAVSKRLQDEVRGEQALLPIAQGLSNKALRPAHWKRVFEAMGKEYDGKDHCLRELLELGVAAHGRLVQEITVAASAEYAINCSIDEIEALWQGTAFELKAHREDESMVILGGLDDIIELLEDNQVQIQAMLASRYVSGVQERVVRWDTQLAALADVLDEWVQVQKHWLFLEFIFASADIQGQLPDDANTFSRIDTEFRELMGRTSKENSVIRVLESSATLLPQLQRTNADLEAIQKHLEEYLETKRAVFPRFYFLSNDEMLSILSDVRNPSSVLPHLTKIFDNIKSIRFNDETCALISAMCSNEGEEVKFSRLVSTDRSVEYWLGAIEKAMLEAVHQHLKATLEGYNRWLRVEWYMQYPAQCVLTVDAIVWTRETEEAIRERALVEYLARYKRQIAETVDAIKGDWTTLQRKVISSIIVLDVHSRDCLVELVQQSVCDVNDFVWDRQLRFYWNTTVDDCIIRQCNATLPYGHEYLGNQPRLVITPLTDRAFLTCTLALSMHLGVAPQGPAGTGKTESVKDLGKAVARQVVVFNCSDGLNHKTMSQMFAGLAQAGAWACFDEFNRIPLEVLSVVAQQMLEITAALAQRLEAMSFDGRDIMLNKNFGVFTTMNPGYAGRTELPDNLKALFRPVCMMIPDYALIAEIMFLSEGFQEATVLSRKMVQLYKLASEQLSKQDHYDFGMRAVKAILVLAGSLKRCAPDTSEESLLIEAMIDANVPKFLRHDSALFTALIRDLFPTVRPAPGDEKDKELKRRIRYTMKSGNLCPIPSFTEKVVQLYHTMTVRHGVMTVGATLTGKTTACEVLSRSMVDHVALHWINPKAVTMGELYGMVNVVTQEWADGVLSKIARGTIEEAENGKSWIVLDGPVDAVWVENLNTVLDDNRILCLVNGERIKLPASTTFLFEVEDLKVASPATVSRCGMVHIEPVCLGGTGWRPAAVAMSTAIGDEFGPFAWRDRLVVEYMDLVIDSGLEFVRKECKEYIATVDGQLVTSLLRLMQALIALHFPDMQQTVPSVIEDGKRRRSSTSQPVLGLRGLAVVIHGAKKLAGHRWRTPLDTHLKPPKDEEEYQRVFKRFFAFAFIYAIGGNVADSTRQRFSVFASKELRKVCPDLPATDDVFSLTLDDYGKWTTWSATIPRWVYDPTLSFFNLIVPIPETVRLTRLMKLITHVGGHVLVNGMTGVGKSVFTAWFMNNTLKADEPDSPWCSFSAVFSAQTSCSDVLMRVETRLHKKKNNLLGAPPGKRIIFFVDDMNMPTPESHGATPPLEFLRHLLTQKGFYDVRKVVFRTVEDMFIISACGVPGGGREPMTSRLTSRFTLLVAPELGDDSLHEVFGPMIGGFLSRWVHGGHLGVDVAQLLSKQLMTATVSAFRAISSKMLPTPSRSHYIFNLRDVSKVVQGVLQASPSSVPSHLGLVRLWIHEASRVFHDRLVDDNDREWWWGQVGVLTKEVFGVEWEAGYREVLFGGVDGGAVEEYREVTDVAKLVEKLEEHQEMYALSRGNSPLDLVLFTDAVRHVMRILRILRIPRGNALLVGVGGSGRSSLTTLAAHIASLRIFRISISRSYGMQEFREDVRNVLLEAGCEGKGLVFYLSDAHIIDEGMLEVVNSILSTGEVPGLMQPEDHDRIISAVRPHVRGPNKENRGVIIQTFVDRCRAFLKIVLAVSPVGEKFRMRLRQFPSLVNCMAIDWFKGWPDEALHGVAIRRCSKVLDSPELLEAVTPLCVRMHRDVQQAGEEYHAQHRRRMYTTPTSYMSLLQCFSTMLQTHTDRLNHNIQKFQSGLSRLSATQAMVDRLKDTLHEMQPELERATAASKALMETVQQEQVEADTLRGGCKKTEEETLAITQEASRIKDECKAELDKAMPAYYNALDALKSLNKSDITEIRSMASPPDRVKLVLEAVQLLLNERPGWDVAKKMMGDLRFLDRLREFDKDNVPEKKLKALQRYILHAEFQPDIVKRSSTAAMSLCLWVRAIDNYSDVARNIGPKREQLTAAEEKLEKAQHRLHTAQSLLRDVEMKVDALQKKMQAAIDRKDELEREQSRTRLRLARAERLMSGLSLEGVRWVEKEKRFTAEKGKILGAALLAAAFVAYLGPFNASFRASLMEKWGVQCRERNIPCSDDFNLTDLVDPVLIREWGLNGLPMDPFSVQNAIIATHTLRWPLCVDPQAQATSWIKSMERDNGLVIVKPSETHFMRHIENAVRNGLPVLLEGVGETVDPALDPILQRNTYTSGGRQLLRLGDADVDYNPSFRLYITTKLSNPHYLPETQIKVTLINFTVTTKGLEDQLLEGVVGIERSDLEEQQGRMVVEIGKAKRELDELEERTLALIAAASDDILDDEELIQTLSISKETAGSITANLVNVQRTSAEILKARERYRPVAARGSLLYSAIDSIGRVDHMYQFSLEAFKQAFNSTLKRTPRVVPVEARVEALLPVVTEEAYRIVCRGLFERDKQLFAFLMASEIFRNSGHIPDGEWLFLLRGPQTTAGTPMPSIDVEEDADDGWITQKGWDSVVALSAFPAFTGLDQSVALNVDGKWGAWCRSDDPHVLPAPAPYDELDPWNKLLLVRALREDKVVFGMMQVVRHLLGEPFVRSPPSDLKYVYQDSSPLTPIIMLLTAGTDATSLFLGCSQKEGMGDRKLMLSLGQDQGVKAAEMIHQGSARGEWVLLQNCHVYSSWMPKLERILEQLEQRKESVHPDFRLWLTSMPSKDFPESVLRSGIKVTQEPPSGMRMNLLDSVNSLEGLWADSRGRRWRRLLFALVFFHAAVQERRKFGALGWTVPYQWSHPDLSVSVATLRDYLSEGGGDDVPWTALRYLIGCIHYGGRVTDFMDMKCLRTLLNTVITPEVLNPGQFPLRPDDETYYIPDGEDLDHLPAVREHISRLPMYDRPSLFGLHDNAEIRYNITASKRVLDILAGLQPRMKSEGGVDAEHEVKSTAEGILALLPAPIDPSRAHPDTYKVSENGTETPLGTFCSQEVDFYNSLLHRIVASLHELLRALKGEAVMSADLDTMSTAFQYGKVPNLWHSGGYLSLKPLASWVVDTVDRLQYFEAWNDEGPPLSYWVPGFFFPQGFLTALLQFHSRAYTIPIDDLTFKASVSEYESGAQVDDMPAVGAYTHGFYLEGAKWLKDEWLLGESTTGELYSAMPVILLEPTVAAAAASPQPVSPATPGEEAAPVTSVSSSWFDEAQESEAVKASSSVVVSDPSAAFAADQTHSCPIYKVSSRAGTLSTTGLSTNYITSIDLPISCHSTDHWTLRGVALLCMLDD